MADEFVPKLNALLVPKKLKKDGPLFMPPAPATVVLPMVKFFGFWEAERPKLNVLGPSE